MPPKNTQVSVQSLQIEQHQGPLPKPSVLHEYDTIVPGAAERIIKMAEEQAKHRQDLERSVIQSDIRDGRTGLFLGFIIGIVAILAGAYCIAQGHSVAGGVLGGSAVPGLRGRFMEREREREKKKKTCLIHFYSFWGLGPVSCVIYQVANAPLLKNTACRLLRIAKPPLFESRKEN